MAKKSSAIALRPEVYQLYKEVDPALPMFLLQVRDRQLEREYKYASRGQWIAAIGMVGVIGGFIYLVMKGHEYAAGSLLGTGAIGLVLAFVRTRLLASPTEQAEPVQVPQQNLS